MFMLFETRLYFKSWVVASSYGGTWTSVVVVVACHYGVDSGHGCVLGIVALTEPGNKL